MIKIAICDDEKKSLDTNKGLVESFCSSHNIPVFIETYPKGDFLLYDIQDGSSFDLILLDIEMPGHNGLNIADRIRHYIPNILIIFVTSHLKYAVDSFELSIFRYIPKNELVPRLKNALQDAFTIINADEDEVYTIHTATRFYKIPCKDILYIEKMGKDCIIKTFAKEFKFRKSLSTIYNELNPDKFAYIDRSCIVNIIHISEIKYGQAVLKNNETLYVSRTHIQELKESLALFWGKKL